MIVMAYQRYAVIMAGGSGERFWPLSRRLRPKQLLKLASTTQSLVEQTLERLEPMFAPENILLATAPHLLEPSIAHLPQLPEANILAEPLKRNTAGAMVWAFASIMARNPDAVENASITVLSADHRVAPIEVFTKTLQAAFEAVENNDILNIIGIKPDRPETGYGYLETDPTVPAIESNGVRTLRVKMNREKPDLATAEEFIRRGGFFWNGGMFCWTLKTFVSELNIHSPEHHAALFLIAEALRDGNVELAEQHFAALPNISIDYALGEKTTKAWTTEATFTWDDVGAWDALERSLDPDTTGNVSQGETVLVETSGSIAVNDTESQTVCVLGMTDVVVVATEDAILVTPKSHAQQVRKIVEKLKELGIDKT